MSSFARFASGTSLGDRFTILRKVGSGRSSLVFQAMDRRTGTEVALKILDPLLSPDPVSQERFLREVHILGKLSHPNIIRVHSSFQEGDFHVIVMEYFEGRSFKSLVDISGPLAPDALLTHLRKLCSIVDSCHQARILHRDLKPQNLLVSENGDLKLVDFGVAKLASESQLTRTGTILGTPEFMAPELFRGCGADPRTDVYGVGAIAYQALTGRPPFLARSIAELIKKHASEEMEPISAFRKDVPQWLESVIRKCLCVDPAARYQSCFEISADLDRENRAAALFERSRQRAVCAFCRADRIAELPFCFDCGSLGVETFSPGNYSLVLHRCEDPALFHRHLSQRLPGVPLRKAEALCSLPVVLMRDMSQPTCMALFNELCAFPCDLQMTDRLPTQFHLPARLLVPILAAAPIGAWIGIHSVAGSALLWAAGLDAIALVLYGSLTRPFLSLRHFKRKKALKLDSLVVTVAKAFADIHDKNLRHILGTVFRSYFSLRRAGYTELSSSGGSPVLDNLAEKIIETAHQIETCATFLSTTNVNRLKQGAQEIDTQIRLGSDAGKRLIEEKVGRERDLRNYLEVQDRHSDLYISLINLNAALCRMEISLKKGTDVPPLVFDPPAALGELPQLRKAG